MSDTPVVPAGEETHTDGLRYVVTGVCAFEFVGDPTSDQRDEIPLMIAKAVAEAVETYTRRNVRNSIVEFVSVSEI